MFHTHREGKGPARRHERSTMIGLGVLLLILALLFPKLGLLWGIGCLLLLVGVVLAVLGSVGRSVGGRRHYY